MIIPDDAPTGDGDGDDAAMSDDDEETIKQDVAKQLEKMGLAAQHKKDARLKRKRDHDDLATDVASGRAYKAKTAGGDVKKKGKLEPYAYIPLDPKLMAKRHKRDAVSRYDNVGKRGGAGKKGKK